MMHATISGKIPKIDKYKIGKPIARSARIMEISVKTNFAYGGRPRWAKKKDGSVSYLYVSGKLFNTIGSGSSVTETRGTAWAGVPMGKMLIYAKVHQYGFNGVRKDGKFMRIPKRTYVMFQRGDFATIRRELSNGVFQAFTTQGEAIL